MGLFGKQIKETSEGVSVVFDSLNGLIDNAFTSKEEKAEALQKLKDAENYIVTLMINAATERHKIDMQSDNKLSKNIRPLTLIFLLGMLAVLFAIKAIWNIEVPDAYLKILESWGGMGIMFYFGSRALEKTGGIASALSGVLKRRSKKDDRT